ncbi:MAG: hypothetical protein PHY92_07235 [Alphaproteobacteria bacterium]|nr:hypothetical protein [Alphaproteobacteria bacterium]
MLDNLSDSIELRGTRVHDNYHGRGLGALALKCVLAVMTARGKTHAIITHIGHDGYCFWPRMGSLPALGDSERQTFADGLPQKLNNFRMHNRFALSDEAQNEIEKLEDMAKQYPYRVWRRLSQTEMALKGGGKICRKIFCHTFFHDDHILIPGEPGTSAVLEKRVGVISPFRDLADNFGHITRELTRTPVEEPRRAAAFNAG